MVALVTSYTRTTCNRGSSRFRSSASLLTNNLTSPSCTTSGLVYRISRERRTCRAGLRIAWASAVAGMVTRMRRSAGRARSASTRRSPRSSAIRPPASKVTPLRLPSCAASRVCAVWLKGAHLPTPALYSSTARHSPRELARAFPSIRRRRGAPLPPRAERTPRCSKPFRLLRVYGSLRADRYRA